MSKRAAVRAKARTRATLSIAKVVNSDSDLLDRRPLQLEGFKFKARSVEVVGKPTLDNFRAAFELAMAIGQGSPFWIGGLVAYADSRHDWAEKLDQAMSVTKYDRHTLHNHGAVYRALSDEAREIAPSFSHAAAVVTLSSKDQIAVLDRARTEGLGVRDVINAVRAFKRPRVIEGQAVLEGKYRVIVADPPWQYDRSTGTESGAFRTAAETYDTMTIDEICKIPLEAHVQENAVLFLWVTAPKLLEMPGPREVIDAWGFKFKTGMIWHKLRHNFGHYVSVRHEHVIIATRGSCLPDRATPMIDSVFTAAKPANDFEHSEKPAELYKIAERLYDGPYLDLFARKPRAGWKTFGNDARLWTKKAAV